MKLLIVLVMLAGTLPGTAQAVLEPPFGLNWGDSPEHLIDWADRHSLDVRITLPGKQPDLRIVRIGDQTTTLPSSQARSLEASFFRGKLFDLAVHYGGPAEEAVLTERRFSEMKKALAAEYGELTANKQDRRIENDFVTRLSSFHREPVRGLFLLLAYTEMEDRLRQQREARFSLIYRNNNLYRQIGGESPPPLPGVGGDADR